MKWIKKIKLQPEQVVSVILVAIVVVAIVISMNVKLNINNADPKELRYSLVSEEEIGHILAEKIIEGRPYDSWEDLESRIDGIGEKRIEILRKNYNLDRN